MDFATTDHTGAPMAESTLTLTDAQVASYWGDGFLAIPQLASADEVAWLRRVYDRLFEQRAGREHGNHFDLAGTDEDGKPAALPQILYPARYAPELLHGQFRVNALAVAKHLLGPDAQYQGEHAILKPARVGAPTPWHQDEAYWGPAMDYNAFSMWIPLQPATPENGCMQFIPGSHRSEVLPHHSIGSDTRVHGLEMDAPPAPDAAVVCPLPAGGCTVHHNRTMHYTGPNRSDEPRRAYILMFGTPPRKRATPRSFPWNAIKRTARAERAERAEAATKAAAPAP